MAKLEKVSAGHIGFHCPGCNTAHVVPVEGSHAWQWNGSLETPTLQPSILYNVGGLNPTVPICHSFVTDGRIQFLADCTHALAGQTVDIPEWGGLWP
jgi:hypothetical protein